MLFSIVVATRNAGEEITGCLDSVLEQEYGEFELLVQDAVSTDSTADRVKSAGDARIRLRVEEDAGIYDAWNRAVARARGARILFLGADDRLHDRQVLGDVARILDTREAVPPVVYGRVKRIVPGGHVMIGQDWREIRGELANCTPIPHQGVLHAADLFRDYGGFDTSYSICADYDLLYEPLSDHEPLFLPRAISVMGDGGLSTRLDSSLRIWRELRSIRRRKGIRRRLGTGGLEYAAALVKTGMSRILGEERARSAYHFAAKILRRRIY